MFWLELHNELFVKRNIYTGLPQAFQPPPVAIIKGMTSLAGFQSLSKGQKEVCFAKMVSHIKSHNIRKKTVILERTAINELKRDKSITILPADKGRATVVLDSSEYKEKVKIMLSDVKTYEVLPSDPTKVY